MLSAVFLIVVYSRKISDYFILLLSSFIFLILAQDFIMERINRFNDGGDGSNNVKIETVKYFFSDEMITFFGYGYLASTESAPLFFQALRDLTFYLNVFTVFGLFAGSIIFSLFVYFLVKSKFLFREKIIIMLGFVKLTNPSVIFFCCFILLLFVINNKRIK